MTMLRHNVQEGYLEEKQRPDPDLRRAPEVQAPSLGTGSYQPTQPPDGTHNLSQAGKDREDSQIRGLDHPTLIGPVDVGIRGDQTAMPSLPLEEIKGEEQVESSEDGWIGDEHWQATEAGNTFHGEYDQGEGSPALPVAPAPIVISSPDHKYPQKWRRRRRRRRPGEAVLVHREDRVAPDDKSEEAGADEELSERIEGQDSGESSKNSIPDGRTQVGGSDAGVNLALQ